MSEIYKHFASPWKDQFDFSEEMLIELFNHESLGAKVVKLSKDNGYALGKSWLNVTVAMWLEDIELGLLFKQELYQDYPESFHWWLDSIFKGKRYGSL